MIQIYLSEREIIVEPGGATTQVEVPSGSPQRSVLGLTLWNVLYDGEPCLPMSENVTSIGYEDDLAIVVTANNEDEAVVMSGRRVLTSVVFMVEGVVVRPVKSIKYLGVWLDHRRSFQTHIKETTAKAIKTTARSPYYRKHHPKIAGRRIGVGLHNSNGSSDPQQHEKGGAKIRVIRRKHQTTTAMQNLHSGRSGDKREVAFSRWESDTTPREVSITDFPLPKKSISFCQIDFYIWFRSRTGSRFIDAVLYGFHQPLTDAYSYAKESLIL